MMDEQKEMLKRIEQALQEARASGSGKTEEIKELEEEKKMTDAHWNQFQQQVNSVAKNIGAEIAQQLSGPH
jgi:ribosome recycling factor